jgi:hypothetical protein
LDISTFRKRIASGMVTAEPSRLYETPVVASSRLYWSRGCIVIGPSHRCGTKCGDGSNLPLPQHNRGIKRTSSPSLYTPAPVEHRSPRRHCSSGKCGLVHASDRDHPHSDRKAEISIQLNTCPERTYDRSCSSSRVQVRPPRLTLHMRKSSSSEVAVFNSLTGAAFEDFCRFAMLRAFRFLTTKSL